MDSANCKYRTDGVDDTDDDDSASIYGADRDDSANLETRKVWKICDRKWAHNSNIYGRGAIVGNY